MDYEFVECCVEIDNEKIRHPKNIKNKKNVNDDALVISSTVVVLKVNEIGKRFHKILRDIMERT